MAAAVPIISIAASALGAYASYESGRQQKKAGEAQARYYEQQAEQERYAAKVKAEQYKKEAERRMGIMRASYAASGVEIGEGTPLLMLMESAAEAAKDETRIKQGGELGAWGLLSEANLARMGGKSAYTSGLMGAGSTLLTGAARMFK